MFSYLIARTGFSVSASPAHAHTAADVRSDAPYGLIDAIGNKYFYYILIVLHWIYRDLYRSLVPHFKTNKK